MSELPRWLSGFKKKKKKWSESVKNLPANAGDAGDVSSVPGSGKSPGSEMATHSSILSWEIPWTEKPDRVSWDRKELDTTERLSTHSFNVCFPSQEGTI